MSTQTTSIDFNSGSDPSIPGTPNFTYSLSSDLSKTFSTSFSTKIGSTIVGTYAFTGGANVTAGLTGGIDLSLGNYTLDVPVTVNVGLPDSVTDSATETFTVDPTLGSVTDANFSLLGPSLTVNLDLGLSGAFKLGFNQGSSIGASFTLGAPSLSSPTFSFGYQIPTTHSFSFGAGSITLSEPSGFSATSNAGTSASSIPTLTATGTDNPFITASVDIIKLLGSVVPAVGALIDGSYDAGIGSLSYSLFSAPLTAGLSLNESLTIKPTGIMVTAEDMLSQQTLTGPLGTKFSFAAPTTGSGSIPIKLTYTFGYSFTVNLGISGSLSLSLDGPKLSGSLVGAKFSLGPLFTQSLFSDSTGLGSIYSHTFTDPLTQTYTYDVPYTNAVCYQRGTQIMTDRGQVAVEALKIGDHVITASGAFRPIMWIGQRAYSARFANNNPDLLPIRFKAGSLGDNIPARDLFVSPEHAMYLDGALIPARHLVNGVSVLKADRVDDDLAYFHIELESHDVLFAEGAAAESFLDDDSRAIFQNAHEYATLYGDETAGQQLFYAPRVDSGEVLARVRHDLAERAGAAAGVAALFGELRGAIEHADAAGVSGWAQDLAYPDGPVCLEMLVDGVSAGLVLAETCRADLVQAGIGDGCHGFSFRFPNPGSAGMITVRRAADGAALPAGTTFRAAA